MTFKTACFLAIAWGIMGIMGAFMELRSSPGTDDPSRQLISAYGQPSLVNIGDPTIGDADQESTAPGLFQVAGMAKDWLFLMARAAMLDHPWYVGQLQIVRVLMLLIAAPFMFIVTREMFQIAIQMFRGVAGAAGGLLGVFFGR